MLNPRLNRSFVRCTIRILQWGIWAALGIALSLLPQPLAAQSSPEEEPCYEKGALRVVMSWDDPFAIGALRVDDPYGNFSTSWKGWPEGIDTPGGIEGGIDSAIPGSGMSYNGGSGSPIEFTLPDPREGTYTIRTALPEWPGNVPVHVTIDLYVDNVLKSSQSRDFVNIDFGNFYSWHWEVGEFVICGDKPLITQVEPQYKLDNTRFLEGISAENEIVVTVDWMGLTPDRVEFKLNGRIVASERPSGRTATHSLNMGSDLDDDLNRLEIIAYGKERDGPNLRPSDPHLFQFYSISMPTWITMLTGRGLMDIPALLKNAGVGATYDMGFKLPVSPFTIDALRFGPPDGEAKFKMSYSGGLSIPIDCVGKLNASVKATGSNIRFLRTLIGLSASGALKFDRKGACGFNAPVGVVTVKGTYKGQLYSKPVPVMVTYFNVVVGQTVDTIVVALHLEKFIGKIGEYYIDGSLGLEAGAEIDFAAPAIKNLRLGGEVGITGGFRSDLKVVEVNVYAGAGGALSSKRPGVIDIFLLNNWEFDKITLKGEVGALFRTAWFVREAKGNITWTYPPSAQQVAQLSDAIDSRGWRLIPHPARPSALGLRAAPDAARAFAGQAQDRSRSGLQTTITSTLVSHIYPYPDTALAVNPADDQALVLWVDVDDAKPLGQAQELFFSRWDGVEWQTPSRVTDDALLDGAPQVAWAGDGQAVALWQRATTPLAPDASLTTTVTRQIEIATAVYSPTTGGWGAVALLTTNSALDGLPQLARGAGGEVAAAWRRNPAGLLVGDDETPDQIVAAFYQNGWQTPAPAVAGIPGLLEFAVGIGAADAFNPTTTIAYTQDVLPTDSITPTAQIFVTTWDGSGWSSPRRLTDGTENQRNPQILYTLRQIPFFPPENEPLLLWLAGNQLHIHNLATESRQTLPLPADILGIDDFRALLDEEGNVAVLFVNESLPRNLYLVYYDQSNQLWGNPRRLTNGDHSLKFPAPAFDSTGRLLAAYAQTAIALQEQTIGGPEPVTYTIPVETQTDLVTLSHLFDYNLKITDADLVFARSETAENQVVISATLHNDSDKAVRNVRVDFYRGDPAINGVWFDSTFISDPIPGNTHTTVTANYAPWFFPEDIYATVSAGSFVESNELDNQARLVGIGADLALVQAEVVYRPNGSAILRSGVVNNGYSDAYDAVLIYSAEGITQPLAQQSLSVKAGGSVTVTTALDLTSLPPGAYSAAAEIALAGTTEFSAEDNRAQFPLYVLPDLQVGVEIVDGAPLSQTTVVISATVRNGGAAPTGALPLHFYSAGDLSAGHLLHSVQVAALAPGSAQTVTVPLSGPLCQLYLFVDPTHSQDELSRANNIAALLSPEPDCRPEAAPAYPVHLPMITGGE